jgi:hypothetical protein
MPIIKTSMIKIGATIRINISSPDGIELMLPWRVAPISSWQVYRALLSVSRDEAGGAPLLALFEKWAAA